MAGERTVELSLEYQATIQTYTDLMQEIKRRHNVILSVLHFSFGPDERTKEEFCIFNLRMICELIALSCLLVHGRTAQISRGKLKTAYQADVIIKILEKLHPDFYPRPGIQEVLSDGKINVVPVISGYLSKVNLIALYRKVRGGSAHR